MEKIILFFLLFTSYFSKAQIQELFLKDWEHALYDVKKINDTTIVCIGENDEIFLANILTKEKKYFTYTTKGIAWLSIAAVQNDTLYVTGDHQSLGVFDLKNFKGMVYFKNSANAYYCSHFTNNTIITAGGSSAVANGIKKIPNGEVKRIFMNGKSSRIAKRKFRFFFHITASNDKLYTYGYGIRNTKMYEIVDNTLIKKSKVKRLVHRALVINGDTILCGTTNYRRKNSFITYNSKEFLWPNQDVVWDAIVMDDLIIGAGSNGKIYRIDKNTLTATIQYTNYKGHFYRLAALNKNEFVAVGQSGLGVIIAK